MSQTVTGRVYKIQCQVADVCYIGSTFNTLRNRWQLHKRDYGTWLKDRTKSCVSIYPFFEKHGIENFKILLVKEYQVCRTNQKDRKHLAAYETLWICRHRKTAVNKYMPVNYFSEKARHARYYAKNLEKVKAIQAKYRTENPEKVKARHAKYRVENPDTKITCGCGSTVLKRAISRHKKSKKHQKWASENPLP